MDHLDYVGILAVELFETAGELLANEIAPRVHNSGQWTIEAAATSQFSNHLRAVLSWCLGSTAVPGQAAMINLVGDLPDTVAVLQVSGAHLHLYDKVPRPGRKLGHITASAQDAAGLFKILANLNRHLELPELGSLLSVYEMG
jgi:5-(carboxyamino)imidazole ribonucleotide synthase